MGQNWALSLSQSQPMWWANLAGPCPRGVQSALTDINKATHKEMFSHVSVQKKKTVAPWENITGRCECVWESGKPLRRRHIEVEMEGIVRDISAKSGGWCRGSRKEAFQSWSGCVKTLKQKELGLLKEWKKACHGWLALRELESGIQRERKRVATERERYVGGLRWGRKGNSDHSWSCMPHVIEMSDSHQKSCCPFQSTDLLLGSGCLISISLHSHPLPFRCGHKMTSWQQTKWYMPLLGKTLENQV